MALGFTSHYNRSDKQFGTLLLGNTESETTGSVASKDTGNSVIFVSGNNGGCDSCDFSVSVDIDYSQYANYVSSSGECETAGSIAYSGGGVSTAATVSSFSGGGFSGGGCSTSFTC